MAVKKITLLCLSLLLLFFGNIPASARDMDFSSPEATFKTYLRACKAMDFEKADMCYTKEFRDFIKTNKRYRAHRHPGQLKNEYHYLHGKKYKLERHGRKAIMRFSKEFDRPEPLYFVKERGAWKIDGMFSFDNVVIEDSAHWHWRNPSIDNEKEWLRK